MSGKDLLRAALDRPPTGADGDGVSSSISVKFVVPGPCSGGVLLRKSSVFLLWWLKLGCLTDLRTTEPSGHTKGGALRCIHCGKIGRLEPVTPSGAVGVPLSQKRSLQRFGAFSDRDLNELE